MYKPFQKRINNTTYEIIEARKLNDVRFVKWMEGRGRVVYEDREGTRYYMEYGQLIEAKTVDADGVKNMNIFVPAYTCRHQKRKVHSNGK